jgi:hypothetical protein
MKNLLIILSILDPWKCACISRYTLASHIGNYVKKYYIKHINKNRKGKNKTRDGDSTPSTPQREAVEGGSTFAHLCGVEDPPPVPLL